MESSDISPVSGASIQDSLSNSDAMISSNRTQKYKLKISNQELEDHSELHHNAEEKLADTCEENIKKEIKEENVEEDDDEEQIDVGDHSSEELVKTSDESSTSEESAQPVASEQS